MATGADEMEMIALSPSPPPVAADASDTAPILPQKRSRFSQRADAKSWWPSSLAEMTRKHWISLGLLTLVLVIGISIGALSSAQERKVQSILPAECQLKPPQALRVPTNRTLHGDSVVDEFDWMKAGLDDARLIDYIKQENLYTDSMMNGQLKTARLAMVDEQKRWDTEIKTSMPFRDFWVMHQYVYYKNKTRTYTSYHRCRRPYQPSNMSLSEEMTKFRFPCDVILDVNTMVDTQDPQAFLGVGTVEISHDESFMAYSLDRSGNESYVLYAVDLQTGKLVTGFGRGIRETYYSVSFWGGNLFYTVLDSDQLPRFVDRVCITGCTGERQFDEWGYLKGTRVYEEKDITMATDLTMTSDNEFLLIVVSGQVTSETLICMDTHCAKPRVVIPRVEGEIYSVVHSNNTFFILSNHGQINYCLYHISHESLDETSFPWDYGQFIKTINTCGPGKYYDRVEAFKYFVILWGFDNGQRRAWFIFNNMVRYEQVDIPDILADQISAVTPSTAGEVSERVYRRFNVTSILFSNVSYTQPWLTFEYDVYARQVRGEVLRLSAGYAEKGVYMTRKLYLEGWDGVRIPVDFVFHRDLFGSSTDSLLNLKQASVFTYVYGSYGGVSEPRFDPRHFSLLTRKVVLMFIHPRGEADYGPQWYFDGKLDKKINTFLDVRACLLQARKWGWVKSMAIFGRSAGGLVTGTSMNWLGRVLNGNGEIVSGYSGAALRSSYPENMERAVRLMHDGSNPDNALIDVVITEVPFVDVITDTMNASIPWTAYEWTEWGNPENATIYKRMMDYSPYDQVRRQHYPAVYVTAGFKDSRVQFYEPTKMVAKIRQYKLNEGWNACGETSRPLLLRVTDAGHFGGTGEARYQDISYWMTFLLHHFDLLSTIDVYS